MDIERCQYASIRVGKEQLAREREREIRDFGDRGEGGRE